MRFLWIFVLLLSFGATCNSRGGNRGKQGRRQAPVVTSTEGPPTEKPISPKIEDAHITYSEIIRKNNSINFDLEWTSSYKNIYSYSVVTTIPKSLNISRNVTSFIRRFAVGHNDSITNYSKGYKVRYFRSSTYQISISICNETRPLNICGSFTNCTMYHRCKLPRNIFYHTAPIKPEIHLKNMISCDNSMCEIDVNITNIQKENSSLYVFQLKNEGEITMDFVKNIRRMEDKSAIEIPWNNPDRINVKFHKTNSMCNNTIYLLLVNDYMELLNYTTQVLLKEQIDCTPKKRSMSRTSANEPNGNYYYLIIIAIILIAIGILAFIKRKSLHTFYKKITTNQPVIDRTTNVPLMLKTTLEKPKKFLDKFKKTTQSLTAESLKVYLEGNPARIITTLTNEFKNVPEDVSQQIYGESFEVKNRYRNILPYVESRVVLNLLPNKADSHYINASYIQGYQNNRKYIATQGPTAKTLGDFWRMVWQERTALIIMLTNVKENGSKKCEQYWPNKGAKLYGDYTVIHKDSQKQFEYTKRQFVISHKDSQREVTQLHFTIWPDKGIPETPYSLVKLLRESRTNGNTGPIVVHCSAGIGRSGSFILCDYVIDMLESGSADFPAALYAMRECRKNMVQFASQYLYSYCVVNEYLNGNLIEINVEEFKRSNLGEGIVEETLRNIENCDYWLNILYPSSIHHGYNQNKEKHRKNTQQPINSAGFISVQYHPNNDKESYYIDAVEILSEAGNIISTSQPLPNTLSPFWRLISEKNITIVLSLQELDVKDETSIKFWPTTEGALKPLDFITLTLIEHTGDEAHETMHVKLEDSKTKEFKYVYILHFKNWKRNSLPEIGEFLLYHKKFAEYLRQQPILVACYDAADASSVFITFLLLLEKLKRNLTIDVNAAVSTLKIYRKNFHLDAAKLKFLYDVMKVFVQDLSKDFYKDTDEIYENLKSE